MGLCGTGLETFPTVIAGKDATKYVYDNKELWDFIIFNDMPGCYTVYNEGASVWWDEYGEEAMSILSTAELAKDILTYDDALRKINGQLSDDYKNCEFINTNFDIDSGIWTFTFISENTNRLSVKIDQSKNIIE